MKPKKWWKKNIRRGEKTLRGRRDVEGEYGRKRETREGKAKQNWMKTVAAGWSRWKEDGARSHNEGDEKHRDDRRGWLKSEWKSSPERSGGRFAVAQNRTLCWQEFECCHKLNSITKRCVCACVCVCFREASPHFTVLGVCEEQGHWRLSPHGSKRRLWKDETSSAQLIFGVEEVEWPAQSPEATALVVLS